MSDIEFIQVEGGVTAPAGIRAAGVHAGFRKDPKRLDAALVVSDGPHTTACGMFTKNVFCAAPVQVDRELLATHRPRAVLLNSGNANAATGEPGLAIARKSAQTAAQALGLADGEVLVASTGVIGVELPWAPFEKGIPMLVEKLSKDGGHDAVCAIMTTDTHSKECAVRFTYDGNEYAVGGMVKGSGMIQPNMATMLAVVTTDMPVSIDAARVALKQAVDVSFNKVTVDSDTSTNDSVFFFSSGMGAPVANADEAASVLAEALRLVCENLARQIAADGEGATKLVTVYVRDANDEEDADRAARTIANSPLVKTAIAGHDCNWGRIAAALGRSGASFDQYGVDIDIMAMPVLRAGLPCGFDEDEALRRFEDDEIVIEVSLGTGGGASTRVWTCDLTHEYIHINADYRS
ncbi:MAG: bifunctional glutamate N-acetyltransferase/amino-acid acetyltransferase ArgJ [Coriobacteriales bacterium]